MGPLSLTNFARICVCNCYSNLFGRQMDLFSHFSFFNLSRKDSIGLHMGPNNLCYICRTSLFIFSLCHHVTFYKTLTSLSTVFIKGHVGCLQLLKSPCSHFFFHPCVLIYLWRPKIVFPKRHCPFFFPSVHVIYLQVVVVDQDEDAVQGQQADGATWRMKEMFRQACYAKRHSQHISAHTQG